MGLWITEDGAKIGFDSKDATADERFARVDILNFHRHLDILRYFSSRERLSARTAIGWNWCQHQRRPFLAYLRKSPTGGEIILIGSTASFARIKKVTPYSCMQTCLGRHRPGSCHYRDRWEDSHQLILSNYECKRLITISKVAWELSRPRQTQVWVR